MVEVLARLHYLTGEERYRQRAEAIVAAFSGAVLRTVFPFATLINAADFLQNAVQIVLAGAPGDAALARLERAVYDRSVPNRIVIRTSEGAELPPGHPAAGKGPVHGKPAAYVCRGQTFSLPITDPEALGKALQF
jgi:uncharacterized protein YyaL (SSP411 family)